jgi:hypothetical protein
MHAAAGGPGPKKLIFFEKIKGILVFCRKVPVFSGIFD